jgi:glycosyltransferase involved in cell wall biosynthesis
MPSISVVIPVYNSQDSIGLVIEKLAEILPTLTDTFEAILVEDNGGDNSWDVIQQLSQTYDWVHGFKLMRNYGQHSALLCGIRYANHDVIVTMDDDLQHPTEKISALLNILEGGYDVVYGTPEKQQHGLLRDIASQMTKIVLQGAMGAETARSISAFRVFRTSLREAFADYRGPLVNIDVLLTWGTTDFTAITTPHAPRTIGASNYTFGKLVTHTFNMVTGFSTLPLRFASFLGLSMTVFGFILLFYIIVIRIVILRYDVPGFTFTASIISVFAGAQLFTLGIIGEYLARMHLRIMDKPAYIIGQSTQISEEVTAEKTS